jgi:DNA polymerase III sliding clamp (beta) subunit (PCNA family)
MKISVETKPLLKALSSAKVLTKNKNVCILNYCSLSAYTDETTNNGIIRISAVYVDWDKHNEDNCVSCDIEIPCSIEEEGLVLVNCEELYKFVLSQKKSDTITINTSDKKDFFAYVDVVSGTSKVTLRQGDKSEWPDFLSRLNFDSFDSGITVSASNLIEAIKMTKHSLSKDLSRPKYCNYYIDVTDEKALLVAISGHTLSCVNIAILKTLSEFKFDRNGFGEVQKINIDPRSLEVVSSLFNDSKNLNILKKDKYICITDNVSCVIVRDMEYCFNFNSIIDADLVGFLKYHIDRDALINSVKNISAATFKTNAIGLRFNLEYLQVFTQESFAKYDSSEEVICEPLYNYVPRTIGINYKYLLDSVKGMSKDLLVYIKDEDKPIYIRNMNSHECLKVIMPVSIK